MAALVGLIWVWYFARPGFELILRNDSRLYVKLARQASLDEILSSIRTVGYPLFLRAVERFFGGLEALPAVQLVLYGCAAVLFCAALERFGLSGWAAVAGAAPLLFSSLVPHLAPSAMTEIPAITLVLVGFSALLVLGGARRWRGGLWIVVGSAVFGAYQVRPAFLFLVPWVPLAVWGWSRFGFGAQTSRAAIRRAGVAAGVTVVPLLVFCLLRWFAVGHFGLVAFTGHNISGLAASMLSEGSVETLPDRHRLLAARILRSRTERGLEPLTVKSPFERWQEPFIVNSWRIAIPEARGLWRERYADRRPDVSRDLFVDQRLSRLSLAVIARSPLLYGAWLGRAWLRALRLTLFNPWVWGPLLLLVTSALVWRYRRLSWAGITVGSGLRPAWGFLALAALFYLLSLALILLTQPPEWRYLTTSELLLPGGLLALAVELWRDS